MTADEVGQRVLVIVAHPDDVDYGAAGTVALWTSSGSVVKYCVVTDGGLGGRVLGPDGPRPVVFPEASPADLAAVRQREQRLAAERLGVTDLVFLGYPDLGVVVSPELRHDLTREIRRFRPTCVVCPSPDFDYRRLANSHPDHRAVGEAALWAVYPGSCNPFAFPELTAEGLAPHRVQDVWLMWSPRPDRVVDISGTIGRKVQAVLAHSSQVPDPIATSDKIRMVAQLVAEEGGLGPGRFAEAFAVGAI